MTAARGHRSRWPRVAIEVVLVAAVGAGVAARLVGLPLHVAESGDEWGNMVASFRVLYERGNPGAFIHPALYYDITAAVFALVFAAARLVGAAGTASSPAELLAVDQTYFVYAARCVSLLAAIATLGLLQRLGTALWSSASGWAAAALLALLPLHVLYAKTVRVDGLFVALFVWAAWRVVGLPGERDGRRTAVAALAVGLATAANYNGGLLVFWLLAVLRLDGARGPELLKALLLSAAAFAAVNPYALLDFSRFAANFSYQAGLAATVHPGWESRDAFFYVADLWRVSPPLVVVVAASVLGFAVFGSRRERLLLSIPLVYFALFSALRTREDRFMLPALALLLLFAGGLPALTRRCLTGRPRLAVLAGGATCLAIAAALATMVPVSLTIPQPMPHEVRPRYAAGVLDWIETRVPERSTILVESGIVPMLDTAMDESPFGETLRRALVARRPRLDHAYRGAVFLGGCNYDPGPVRRGAIDYAVVAPRNVQYIEGHCDVCPPACEVYAALRAGGEVVMQAPQGFEPVVVYALRR